MSIRKLTRLPIWRPYKTIPRDNGKQGKPPHCPKTGKLLKCWNDPSLEITYEEAENAVDVHGLDGIGFITTPGFFVIDIDEIAPGDSRVLGIVESFGTYAESSPSGNGIHIIGTVDESRISEGARKKWTTPNGISIELFMGRDYRYVTFTDNPLEVASTIEDCTDVLLQFMVETGGLSPETKNTPVLALPVHEGTAQVAMDAVPDEALLQKAFSGQLGEKYKSLFNGNLIDYKGNHSSGDLALCGSLARAALLLVGDCNPAQIDRIFRTSQLMREKWDETRIKEDETIKTYGENTVTMAITFQKKQWEKQRVRREQEAVIDELFIPEWKPSDFSHVGQAEMLAIFCGRYLKHSAATKFLTYNGEMWEENQSRATKAAQALSTKQLAEAVKMVETAKTCMKNAHDDEKEACKKELAEAKEYHRFVLKCRENAGINGVLSQVKPMVPIDVKELDKDPFLLNTPQGTYDLRSGVMHKHNPEDYCTKMTAVSPSDKGMDIFLNFMRTICCNDQSLVDYIQCVMGLAAIGKVFHEHLIIAYGKGANGKSTLFNTIGRVLGDYYHTIPPESLLANPRGQKDYNLPELRGRRFVIAAETEEGKRLSESSLKRITSKDAIHAEKKYKAPFKFVPSHTTILFTNFLPKVGSLDHGTWRRITPIPFMHKFTGKDDIKDFAEHLFRESSEAILKWIIDGALKVQANKFDIKKPQCVEDALNAYREDNDWVSAFVDECCEKGAFKTPANRLYKRYREYADEQGEFARNNADFKKALQEAGYGHNRTSAGYVYTGLKLKHVTSSFQEEDSDWASFH